LSIDQDALEIDEDGEYNQTSYLDDDVFEDYDDDERYV
jgi:hypothetical protein|tara:strand:+ start:222 stop:335 length:114 start_codon:yes stop_codon:yes gene_type:complete